MIRALRGLVALAALLGSSVAQETLDVSQPEPGTLRLGDTALVSIKIGGKSARHASRRGEMRQSHAVTHRAQGCHTRHALACVMTLRKTAAGVGKCASHTELHTGESHRVVS